MNVDRILDTFRRHEVAYLLIGGMNFLLRHAPLVTFDVDLWLEDTPDNLNRCEAALAELDAEWGASHDDWGPVAARPAGWLRAQSVFCLTSPHGAIDIFRSVRGLESWAACRGRARLSTTSTGVPFVGLSDEDMLQCQLALPVADRNQERIRLLRETLGVEGNE